MQKETHFGHDIAPPLNLRQQLLEVPGIVRNQKKERALLLISILTFVAINFGLYTHYESKQKEATMTAYLYLTRNYQYPWSIFGYCVQPFLFWLARISFYYLSSSESQSIRQDWAILCMPKENKHNNSTTRCGVITAQFQNGRKGNFNCDKN